MNFPAAAKNRILAAVSGVKGNVRLSVFVGAAAEQSSGRQQCSAWVPAFN